MYVACWAFTRTPLWFLYWYYWYGYGSGDCHLPVVLILMFTRAGYQDFDHPRTSIEDYPIYLVFDLDMVHLTTLDRKIMGQMVRRRLRHAPCHCSRPLDETYPSWGLVWHFSSGCWVKIRDHEMLDYQLNPTDSICVCSQACFCKFWRCFPT